MSATQTPLSRADTAWLHMDRPTNLMVINSVLLFDEPLAWDRLAEVVRTRLVAAHPRFRERVVESRLPIGGARWEPDPDFDLARHLHRRGLPSPGNESALQALAGDLASIPLDRAKPLWDMYLIDGPQPGSAVIVRMHHCIADGIALAQVMLSLTDPADGATAHGPAAAVEPATRDGIIGGPLGSLYRTTDALVRAGIGTLVHPRRVLDLGDGLVADARAAAKLLLTPPDARSALEHDAGAARSVAWSRPLSLPAVKEIAKAHGATINDVMLAAVSGALRGYLKAIGEEPHPITTMVPVNLRPVDRLAGEELGNRFGLVFLTLPVDLASRRERLHELKDRMDAIKNSAEGPVSYAMLEAAGSTSPEIERLIIDFFTAKATAVMTNVPGPRQAVSLAGSPMRTVLVWAPTAGSVGMSVSIFSYDSRITVGLLTHTAQVPRPGEIVARLHREVAALARLAPDA